VGPGGWLKLTASDFNRQWISMPTVLVAVPTVTPNSLHPLSTSSITACHLLDFMVQGKITDAGTLTTRLDATASGPSVPHLHHPHIFMLNVLSAATLPIYPGLGQAPNNAGLHTWLLGTLMKH